MDESSKALEPPVEPPTSIWTRRLILLAFWAVIVTLGLPHWIWTTSIHRSDLPHAIGNWSNGHACPLHFPLYIQLKTADIEPDQAQHLAKQVEVRLNDQNDLALYEYHVTIEDRNILSAGESVSSPVQDRQSGDDWSVLVVNLQADQSIESTQAFLRSWIPLLDFRYNPGQHADISTLAPFVAGYIQSVFENEKDSMSYLLSGSPFATPGLAERIPSDARASLEAKTTRAFKYAASYHLTFSLFASTASPSQWDIQQALEEYIQPLLTRLSGISKFSIDTQVQLFASFSPSIAGPQYNSSTKEWKLLKTDLSGFINAAEWPLNPSIGSGPTINFVLYVPSSEESPLVIAETGGNSWLIPQWGGVQILNLGGKQREKLTSEVLEPVMLTFADQLSSLLGLPSQPLSLSMRISALTRHHATSLILSTASTLGALLRLTRKLTSIAIPDSVAESVNIALTKLEQACIATKDGKFQTALELARTAEYEAEQAFFEPSMVGQVYFPDEHKVAVYVPLLGPMAVPLIMAGLKELKKWKESRKAKSE